MFHFYVHVQRLTSASVRPTGIVLTAEEDLGVTSCLRNPSVRYLCHRDRYAERFSSGERGDSLTLRIVPITTGKPQPRGVGVLLSLTQQAPCSKVLTPFLFTERAKLASHLPAYVWYEGGDLLGL